MFGWLRRKPEPLVDRWYRGIAEELVPSSSFAWVYAGWSLSRTLGIPEEHPWPGFLAKGVHLIMFCEWEWAITLTPGRWQTPPGLPPWAIEDGRYLTRTGAVTALTRSIKMLDQAHTDPEARAGLLAREGGLSLAPTGNLSVARRA